MVNIRFFVTDFASHKTWAEGYQRFAWKQKQNNHEVRLNFIPGDRWKFRMMAAAAELESQIALDDEIVVVDAMIDVTVLVALLKSNRPQHHWPLVLVYFHENQLTTPFTSQDRDRKHQTHWHYGITHWRSLLVADGCIFNSETHLKEFSHHLPKILNEQCPRDAVEWHLNTCQELLAKKCTILRYGLDLEALVSTTYHDMIIEEKGVPVILWNARLEEDKDPTTFLEMIGQIPETRPYRLIILGDDPSKGQKWFRRFQHDFRDRILFMGWCAQRSDYASWLRKASIVVSTANHETFGISIVESVYCGALPLLPNKLSYPELFASLESEKHLFFYNSIHDGIEKILQLMHIIANDPVAHRKSQSQTKAAVTQFRWDIMGPVYDYFFHRVAKGVSIVHAGEQSRVMAQDIFKQSCITNETKVLLNESQGKMSTRRSFVIDDENDSRVQLFRPRSLRNHREYENQRALLREEGVEAALHGGRRAMVRMLEAIQKGANIRPICFLTTQELADSVVFHGIKESTEGSELILKAPVYLADKELLCKIRGQKVNAGDAILAMVQFPVASELQEILSNPPILILDNVRNAENVGSILRTAFCLGITSIVASETAWAALKDSRAARCSMGTMYYHRYYKAEDRDKTGHSCNLSRTIQAIRERGVYVYGIEIGDCAKCIAPHKEDKNWAAIVGNEDVGLSSETISACDQITFIPQVHGNSLNVGHAAAIALYELGKGTPVQDHDGLATCT